jgi:hypothetical protein
MLFLAKPGSFNPIGYLINIAKKPKIQLYILERAICLPRFYNEE